MFFDTISLLIKFSFQMLIKSKCCDKMPLESSTLQIAAWREISKEFQNQALSITVTLWQTTKMHNNKFSLFPLKQCQPFLSDLSLKKKSLYTRLFILLCFFFYKNNDKLWRQQGKSRIFLMYDFYQGSVFCTRVLYLKNILNTSRVWIIVAIANNVCMCIRYFWGTL